MKEKEQEMIAQRFQETSMNTSNNTRNLYKKKVVIPEVVEFFLIP
jgi:hypothetical protein